MAAISDFDSRSFRDALSKFATGVALVTTRHAGRPMGIVINSFASVSLDPPLVLWSIDKSSRRRTAFEQAERQAIHIMAAAQHADCMKLAKDPSDFDGFDQEEAAGEGPPLIRGCLARFECEPYASVDAGDHVTLIQRVITTTHQEAEPLVFFNKGFGQIQNGSP